MRRARKNELAVAAVVGVVLLLALSRQGASVTLPSGDHTKTQTGGDDSTAWARSRFLAAFAAVKAHGETDDAIAHDIALSILTHWAIETANGVGEFNYNVGNINVWGSQAWFPIRDIDGTIHAERAFPTLGDGVDAYLALLNSDRYKAAMYSLANKPASADWYLALGKSGWFDPTKAKPPGTWSGAAALFDARRAALSTLVAGVPVSGDDEGVC